MNLSTITASDIVPEATKAIKRFLKGSKSQQVLGTPYQIEDLAMDAAEKVIRANPMYLTKSYVWIAARCVCINVLNKKSINVVDPVLEDELSLEDLMEGDTHNHMGDLHKEIRGYLSEEQLAILDLLLEGHMYVVIAEKTNVSLRTLERQVQELKWTIEYLLTENDPDTNNHSYLFNQ
jgi:DNA-directed RNA polymerase specialized sigma24 family protein